MGCDIHLHVEIKVKDKWMHYNHPRIERNYILFYKMAGVRPDDSYDFEPISVARGLPGDLSETTNYDYELWPEDYHNMSWLSSKEVDILEEWYEKRGFHGDNVHGFNAEFGYLFGNNFRTLHEYPEDSPEGLEDFRFVFWFDC